MHIKDNKTYFIMQDIEYMNGRNYYINYLLKSEGDIIDTVFRSVQSTWLLQNISIIDDKLLVYGNKDTIITVNTSNNDISKIVLPDYISDCKIENNTIHLLLFDENINYYYTNTYDFGETYSANVAVKSGSLSVNNNRVYLLTSNKNTNEFYQNTLYQINDSLIELHQVESNLYLHKIIANDDLILFGGRDSVYYSSDNGLSWNSDFFYEMYNWKDLEVKKDKVFILSNNDIYYKKLPIISSVVNNSKNENIIIYPNPSSEYIHIQTDQLFEKYTIYDLTGRILKEGKHNKNIDIGVFTAGVYILKLEKGNDVFYKKFVVK